MMELFIYWLIYAFFGWITETLYTSLPKGNFQDRGFLSLPIIPIYGFGALIVIYLLKPWSQSPLLVFILGILATSLLEYLTSYAMEKLFNMRWWDYSERKYNLKGRICLRNSLLFGLLSVALVEYIHPLVRSLNLIMLNRLSPLLMAVISLDFIHSVSFSLGFSKIHRELAELRAGLLAARDHSVLDFEERLAELRTKIHSLEHRLLRSYPILRTRLLDRLEELRQAVKERRNYLSR